MNQKSMKKVKQCRVCGDEASAFNYNGLSCQSCKMFFFRNSNCTNEELKCIYGQKNCRIDKLSRTFCVRCRLDKCFAIGMIHRPKNNLKFENPISSKNPEKLTQPELLLINELQKAMQVFTDESELKISQIVIESHVDAFNLLANYARKVIKFCKNIEAFKSLNSNDQLITLKGVYFEINFIRMVAQFNPENKIVRLIGNEEGDHVILVDFSSLHKNKIKNKDDVLNHQFKMQLYSLIENDETLRNLIIAYFLFKPRKGVTYHEFFKYQHSIYTRLLRKYLHQKSSNVAAGEKKFNFLISLLDKLDLIKQNILRVINEEIDPTKVDKVLKEVLDI